MEDFKTTHAVEQIKERLLPLLPEEFAMGIVDRRSLDSFSLHPLEAACLGPRAAAKRRKEFIMGRAAAHAALKNMGRAAAAIVKGKVGEPVWPAGVTGSITHKDGSALAVVAPTHRCRTLGVDMESAVDPVHPGISRRVCHPKEIQWVFEDEAALSFRLKLIFSAKESIFKAVNPLKGQFVSFTDIQLQWRKEKKRFHVNLPQKVRRNVSPYIPSPVNCVITNHLVVTLFVLW